MWTRLSNREWTPGCWVQGCGVHTGDWKSMAGLPASHFPHRLMLNGTIRPRMCNNIALSPASFCNQMFDQINTNWNFFRRPTLSDNDPIKVIDFLPKYSFPKRVTISPGNVLIFQIISRRNKQQTGQTNNEQTKQTTNRPNKQQTDQTSNKQTKQTTNRPVWSWLQREKLSAAWVEALPGPERLRQVVSFQKLQRRLFASPTCAERLGQVVRGAQVIVLYGEAVQCTTKWIFFLEYIFWF